MCSTCRDISGGYSLGVPPLPIPNREVKPVRADGTAPQCGRVGRRRFFTRKSSWQKCLGDFLFLIHPLPPSASLHQSLERERVIAPPKGGKWLPDK